MMATGETSEEANSPKTTSFLQRSSVAIIRTEFPARYALGLLAFFGFILNYMLRINMSIAIVAMARSNHNSSSRTSVALTSNQSFQASATSQNEEGEYNWNESTQALVTGAFFWGYIFLQIPGGRFAEIFGAKYIFGLSIFLSGIFTLLVPWAADENPTKLICLRFLLGLCEGATYPSMHAMLARWTPPMERSRMSTFVYSGAQAGTVIALPLGGYIISAMGWRAVFYIMGGMPIVWGVLWYFFVFDRPQDHPRIRPDELKYLEEALSSGGHATSSRKLKVPWLEMLRSVPFVALMVANLAAAWGFWTLLILIPTYLKNILKFDIKSNSLLSAIPYVTMWFFGIMYGTFADYLRSSEKLSTGNVRKLSGIICMALPGILLLVLTCVGDDPTATMLIFTLAVGLLGAKYSAFLSNHLDIAPNFAGTMLGLANAAATIPGWIAPITAGALTNGQQTLEQWHKVFYIASGIYLLGAMVYSLFASGEVQPWNESRESDESDTVAKTEKEKNVTG